MAVTFVVSVSLVLGCPVYPEKYTLKAPPGPNLLTMSPTTTEPYEIVYIKKVSFSSDGSLAHYQLRYKNRKRSGKLGSVTMGYLVDIATGKRLQTYQVQRQGYLCESLKPLWDLSKPKDWGEAFLKKHGFVKSKRQRHPPDKRVKVKVRVVGTKTPVGWLAAWPRGKIFSWVWKTRRKSTQGQKLESRLELRIKRKGKKEQVLHIHRPYLNYHFSLAHKGSWELGRDKESSPGHEFCFLGEEPAEKCNRILWKVGLVKGQENAFTGEVTLHWTPKADAIVVFWDDRQYLEPGTKQFTSVYRSKVTVHSLISREPTKLLARATPPSAMKPPPMTKKPAPGDQAKPMVAAMKEPARAAKTKPPDKKKGCGCHTTSGSPGAGLLGLLLLVAWRRRP